MEINSVTKQELPVSSVQESSAKTVIKENEQAQSGSIEKKQEKISPLDGRHYTAVSKDGDTLEISEDTKTGNSKENKHGIAVNNSAKNAVKMADTALAKCSKSKLKQLLQNGQISKQQYDKALKKKQVPI